MEEIETGERNWCDDFGNYKSIIPTYPTQQGTAQNEGTQERLKKSEVYWCKAYQVNQCELQSPHMAVLKQDELPVPVLHICATCWNLCKKQEKHPEIDPQCPSKKL